MIDAIVATLLTLGSDINMTIQFYREYFAMKKMQEGNVKTHKRR